jgi:hypothetical protein
MAEGIMGIVVRYPMIGTQRRRLAARRIDLLLAISVVMAEGVAGMVVTHHMASIDNKRMERDAEADVKTTHGMDKGSEQDQEGDRLRRRRQERSNYYLVCLFGLLFTRCPFLKLT